MLYAAALERVPQSQARAGLVAAFFKPADKSGYTDVLPFARGGYSSTRYFHKDV